VPVLGVAVNVAVMALHGKWSVMWSPCYYRSQDAGVSVCRNIEGSGYRRIGGGENWK
jgi:hypothetical protein